MRNVKVLWALLALMFVCMLVLLVMLVTTMRTHPPDTAAKQPQDGNQPEDKDQVVATIGDVSITKSQLEQNVMRKYGKELLNEMLDHLAVQMEGEALGIKIGDAEIKQELTKMQMGYDDEESFYKAMAELGMDKESLREDAYYKLLTERIATEGIRIPDDLVDQYIAAHPEEFQNYTQLRLQQIITSTKEQADKVVAQLRNGASFDQLAKDKSLDDATRNDGGDLGWIEEDDPFVDKRILEAARNMKAGEISEPIRLDSTYAVIKLNGRKDVSKEINQQIRENVRRQLALQQAPSLQDLISKLREKYHAKIIIPSFG